MSSIHADMRRLFEESKFLQVVELSEKLDARGAECPEALVLRGTCIQLIKEETHYELVDVERAYKRALELEPNFIPALTELAYFYLNVMDDVSQALPLFERALSLAKSTLNEVTEGLIRSKLETNTLVEVRGYLDQVIADTFERDRFEAIFDEGIWM
jgi:hypothetical protein